MKVRADLRNRLLVSAVAALIAGLSYPAFAGDPVKTRTDYDRPGRQIDDGAPAKTSATTKSFWRGLDDEGTPVKTGDGTKKFGRAAEEDGHAGEDARRHQHSRSRAEPGSGQQQDAQADRRVTRRASGCARNERRATTLRPVAPASTDSRQ